MPRPRPDEERDAFLQRYMGSEEAQRDFPDEKQRYAVALSEWRRYKGVNISKYSHEDDQLVFGWASVAKDVNGQEPLDWQGDIIDPCDLETAVYKFNLEFRESNEMHRPNSTNGTLVESVMFTKEKMKAMGIPEGVVPEGWWVGFHIENQEVFQKVKDGTYKMFSIEGSGTRIPI